MKLELTKFIKTAAAGDQLKYKSRRNHSLEDDFATLLGFQRWHTPIMRPDHDPKWDYFRWGVERHAIVNNIRVMSFRYLYPTCIIELANERDITLPNGWKLADLIECLIQMRKAYKAGYIRSFDKLGDYGNTEDYKEWQMIAKYLINSVWGIICNKGSAINLGGHEIIARAREKVTDAINKIVDSGGVVFHVNVDEIAYYSELQVDIKDVHHEKHRVGLFTGNRGAAWGDDLILSGLAPTLKFNLDDWEPNRHDRRTAEEQRDMAISCINTRKERCLRELRDYINTTKEDIAKRYVDLSGE
ncbi:hypothetical protein phi5_144 [Enterobacter phage phi5]|nr:hypothetical protein phi5_144 [Enterobacter phage phi5]